MKKDIHPKYYPDAQMKCACGTAYTIGSTQKEVAVDICAACHPFYTGKQKLVDTGHRIEKFKERLAKKTATAAVRKGKTVKHAAVKIKRAAKTAKIEKGEK